METKSFIVQVLTRQPLIIITPYGTSIIELINILIESLLRTNIKIPIYTDIKYPLDVNDIPIYNIEHKEDNICENLINSKILIMTNINDNIEYDFANNIIPIYIIEWGIRDHNLIRFNTWIHNNKPLILNPLFVTPNPIPNIISYEIPTNIIDNEQKSLNIHYLKFAENLPDLNINNDGWIQDDILDYLDKFSPKFATLMDNINPPCVIYCPYVEKYGLYFLHEIIKHLGFPNYLHISDGISENSPNSPIIKFFTNNKYGILLTNDLKSLIGIRSEIPIHIISFDSDNGMQLLMNPHYHNTLHIYTAIDINNITIDLSQYQLLSIGINDANRVFNSLINNSMKLMTDKYNNLYII
jgi:hypothetical protein